jgi:hypothetical protein
MKRKIRKFAGDEGSVVRTRSDDEIAADNKAGYGRYMPKTKEYTFDEVKDKLSGLFGGKPKAKDEEAYDYDSDVERVATPKAAAEEPRRKISDYSTNKGTTTVSEEDAPYKVEKTTLPKKEKRKEENVYPGPNDKRKTQPESTLPKKDIGEDVKPAPAKPSVKKEEPKPLPGKSERKSKPTPYSAPRKISDEEKAEADRGKRMEEEAAAQLKKNKEEAKTSAPAAKKKEYYRDFSGKIKEKTPDDRRPLKDLGETISEGAKSVGEFLSKNIKSPAQRRDEEKSARENQKKYGMKKGGSVSSASKRADGIAMRGKTKGKIY